MPRITVAIPSYNHEKYVAQSLQSVLNQTYQDFEIVITDDGSSDGTVDVIKTFTDPRIRLFCFGKNQGASIAMNNCIREAKGVYIAILNSDDLFLPDKLERQITFLESHPEIGAVFGYAQFIDDDGNDFTDSNHPYMKVFKQSNRTRFEWLNLFFYHSNALCHPSVLIRKACYGKVGYYDERFAQMPDFDFWIRLCMKYEIHIVPEYLINFRIHKSEVNASGDRPEANARLLVEHTYILKNFLNLKTEKDFYSVFPEAKRRWDFFDERLVPFFVSMLALENDSVIHQNFAIFTLFDLLKDHNMRRMLVDKCGFTIKDFMKLTGKYDLFNLDFLKTIKQKNKQIGQLQAEVSSQQVELNWIHTSLEWRLLRNCKRIKDRIFPAHTKRKGMYDWTLRYIKGLSLRLRQKNVNSTSGESGFFNKNRLGRFEKGHSDDPLYNSWISKNEPNKSQLLAMRVDSQSWSYQPMVSIIVPVYNPSEYDLTECLNSVLVQTYQNWELCIVDGGSDKAYVKEVIKHFAKNDRRIKYVVLAENKGIAGNSNEALKLSTGEYVAFLDHDDELAPFALYEVVNQLNLNPKLDLIYSDHDMIPAHESKRYAPFFKPDWSPDTFLSYNYLCHLVVVRRTIINKIGGLREGFDGAQDYDLILRIIIETANIKHIPKMLYHWRASNESVASNIANKPLASIAGKKAISDYLKHKGLEAEIVDGPIQTWYRVKYLIKPFNKVCIIIPTKDKVHLLKKCISSILEKTDYKDYEILIVDNQSKEKETIEYFEMLKNNPPLSPFNKGGLDRADGKIRVLHYDKPFNYSAINNFAVNSTDAEYILFLNNCTEVISNEWLSAMLEFAQRNDVGAVGAKLYYPDDTIQHAGIIIGLNGVADHAHRHFPRSSMGAAGRLNIIQNFSAVTTACMMMRRNVFDEVGGFEEKLTVAFNDVDLCLKLREKGYLIVYTPYAELYHYESASRGKEDTPEKLTRANQETEFLKRKWKHFYDAGDPYYNPNLTVENTDFSTKI